MKKITAVIISTGPLSRREAVILRYVCEGYCRQEIADLVCRTVSTVGKQIESIAGKLDCHSAAEIVATAVAADLVRIEISQEHSWFIKCMAVVLMLNITASHVDMRFGPRAPKPIRTTRVSNRLVRRNQRC